MKHDSPCLDCGVTEYTNRRGLCDRCYVVRRRSGLLLPPSTKKTVEFHLLASRRSPDHCWPWTGYVDKQGYGYHGGTGTFTPAHRLAYEYWVGVIPPGMQVDHLCHTQDLSCYAGNDCPHRRCINPSHLEAVPADVNRERAHRPATDECKRGHRLSGPNLYIHRGTRHCRACRDLMDLRSRRARGVKPQVLIGTHCPAGHALDGDNLYVQPGGKKTCRLCRAERRRAWRDRKKGHPSEMAADDPRHGTATGYRDQRCRCEACVQAARKAGTDHRRAARARPLDSTDPRHGTRAGYNYYGCRCDRCVAVGRAGLPGGDRRHGTLTGYTAYRCRCSECVEVQAAYRRRRRADRSTG